MSVEGITSNRTIDPAALAQPATTPMDKQRRKRPATEKHTKWKAWKDEGLSYAAIVRRHKDESGEEVTKDAVYAALKRLDRP